LGCVHRYASGYIESQPIGAFVIRGDSGTSLGATPTITTLEIKRPFFLAGNKSRKMTFTFEKEGYLSTTRVVHISNWSRRGATGVLPFRIAAALQKPQTFP